MESEGDAERRDGRIDGEASRLVRSKSRKVQNERGGGDKSDLKENPKRGVGRPPMTMTDCPRRQPRMRFLPKDLQVAELSIGRCE